MEQTQLNDSKLEDDNQNLFEMSETEDLPITGQKRLIDEESDEEWKIVNNKGKGKKSRLNSPEKEIQKLEVTISCSDKLPKSFALAKLLKANEINNMVHVKYLSPFRIRIQFQDEANMDKLCSCEDFIAKKWRFSKAMEVSYSYGVIKDVELELEEKEILSSLFCQENMEIISVKRLDRRNKEGGWSPCEVVKICFKGNSLPPYVYTDGLRIKVEPYIYPVSQCSRCWKMGHRHMTCPSNKIICPKCGGDHANCETKIFKCINCSGNHMALSKTCPLYLKERRIREIMAEFNCPYKRALTAYVPPSPLVKGQAKQTEVNNPIVYVSSLENTPTFAEVVMAEADVHVEEASSSANLCNRTPLNKKKSSKKKQNLPEFLLEWQSSLAEEPEIDEDYVYEQSGNKQTKGNTEHNTTCNELLSRIKEVIYLKNCSWYTKIKNILKLCIEWFILLVVDKISESTLLQMVINLFNG